MRILVDTSTIIDHTRASKGPLLYLLEKKRTLGWELEISSITIAELWAGESLSNRKEVVLIEKLLSKFEIVEFNGGMAKMAGSLKRLKHSQGFDSLIAATAIYTGASLATQNKKHFEKIPKLKLFDLQKTL